MVRYLLKKLRTFSPRTKNSAVIFPTDALDTIWEF
jgi:hypothetical protein